MTGDQDNNQQIIMSEKRFILGFVSHLKGTSRRLFAPLGIRVRGWTKIAPDRFVSPHGLADVSLYLLANETDESDLESLGWKFAKDSASYSHTFQIDISKMNSLANCQGHPLDYVCDLRDVGDLPEKVEDCPQIRGFAWATYAR